MILIEDDEVIGIVDDTVRVELHYPHLDSNEVGKDKVRIELTAVRVSAPIRVSFDFNRNGWKVEQEVPIDISTGEDASWGIAEAINEWLEVSFIPAIHELDIG